MQLHEKLAELIGHEVLTTTNQPVEGNASIPRGVIKEVGADYLVIHTARGQKGGFAETGADCLVRLEAMVFIIHMHNNCKKCVENTASEETKKGRTA